MSNFPQKYDDDTTLPIVNDNLTEIGGEAINALRDAVFNIEQNIGLGAAGTTSSIAARLGLLINPDGTPNASAITSLGLVTLPITNNQIANNAGIPESKLHLDYRTQDLFNYIRDLSRDVNLALGWVSVSGVKLEPHLIGAIYRHDMSQIDVAETASEFLENKFRVLRDNTNSYTLVNDINNELLSHQWADGSPFGVIANVTTNDGSVYPSNYAHVGSGIFIDTSRFQTIPQNDEDVQSIFEYIDSSSILLLGTRIQNLYANGISVNSRSSSLNNDGYGQPIVPVTPCIAYLLYPSGNSSVPVDDINHGDDMIQFMPTTDGYSFDEQFALVNIGDIIRINYGTVEVAFRIREKKYVPGTSGNSSSYYVRIAGKNLFNSPNAVARIDRPLFNDNKYGVLAVAPANNPLTGVPASLIVGSPRGAQALGIGFNADQLDSTHYLLYLALYPDGVPSDGYTILPGIDVTGNQGATPGIYTLDSVVAATNLAFRKAGYNYRFIAFQYQGNFGIMLADSYNNTGFSILNMIVTPGGVYDSVNTAIHFPNNVVGNSVNVTPDALGFGVLGANIASPPLMSSYGSAAASQYPTRVFVPLSRNNFYVNGAEEQRLNLQVGQALDIYGDGYWVGTIQSISPISGPSGRVTTVYSIPLDLSTSSLKVGKTLVVQSLGSGTLTNFGRFIITNVNFEDGPPVATQITVYDAVHATGISPSSTAAIGTKVAIYFNSDSVSFDAENSTDIQAVTPFKRHFEVYVDDVANTYTQERARINIAPGGVSLFPVAGVPLYGSINLSHINIVEVSPKLKGYNFGITKINLQIFSYDTTTGLFDGYLCNYNGTSATHAGPITLGQKGLVTRFYDETNIDYIDIVLNSDDVIPSFTTSNIDIQLFPTLSLDEEIMLLGTCQFNDSTSQITNVADHRQFGNISEEQLTTSAIQFIEAPTRELRENGVIRGLGVAVTNTTTVSFNGGTAIINGKIVQINPQTVDIPILIESLPTITGGSPTTINTVNVITWFVCVNEKSEIELIASTDYNPLGSFASQYTSVQVNHLRLFYVYNPNAFSPSPYQIRGTYFSNLVVTQKDVTPIAIISSTVTNTGSVYAVTSSNVTDARRYLYNGYNGLAEPLTFGVNASFRSTSSLLSWLNQLNNFSSAFAVESNAISNIVKVKGHFILTSSVSLNFVFNEVYFDGEGAGAFDIFTPTGFEVGNNVHFRRLHFNYLYDPVSYPVSPDSGYSSTDLINTGKGLLHLGALLGGGNVSVKECHFNWFPSVSGVAGAHSTSTSVNRYSFINIEVGSPPTSAPVILQDVDISDNTFSDNVLSSFSGTNIESVRAAVSVVCLAQSASTPGLGAKLVDVHIDHNVCDKDQMIAITPVSTALTAGAINIAFSVINCTIDHNICGTIAIFTQYDIPLDINFTTNYFDFIADKNNSLLVSNNTCKYITSTDARGIDLAQISPAINVNSGPWDIIGNNCSWIKLPLNIITTAGTPTAIGPQPTTCNINRNTLLAYDTNFKKYYLNGTTTSLTNSAIELVIFSGSFSGLAVIDNNYINLGGYNTIVPTVNVFQYDIGINTAHDATISHNTILSLGNVIGGGPPIGIFLNSQPGITVHSDIHHNKLYRFATNWQAYIYLGLSGNHTVVHNFFDQTTPDGTNTENSVIGGTVQANNIHDNTNQVINKPIALTDGAFFLLPLAAVAAPTGPATGSNIFSITGITDQVIVAKYVDSFTPTSQNTLVYEFLPSSFTPYFYPKGMTLNIPLSEYVPVGARITRIQLGIWFKVNGSASAGLDVSNDGYNAVTLSLFRSTDALNTISGHVITDIANNIFPAPLTSGTDFTNTGGSPQTFTVLVHSSPSSGSNYNAVTQTTLQSGTQFLTVTPSTPVIVGAGYRINAQMDMNWKIYTGAGATAGDAIIFYFSPLLVTYNW